MYIIGGYIAVGKPEERANASLDSGGTAAVVFFCMCSPQARSTLKASRSLPICLLPYRHLDSVLLAFVERYSLGRVC